MKTIFTAFVSSLLLVIATTAYAIKPEHANYAAQLASGVPSQIKSGGTGLYNAGITDPEIIDVAVEAILQNADKGDSFVDALRWTTKAVINAKNPRYHDAMMSVADNKGVHKKLKKDAKKAAKAGGKPKGVEQYTKGTADLAAIKEEAAKAQAELAKSIKGADGFSSIGVITVGMSSSELVAKCGPPTSTTSHITGKQFIPFNFKGGDTVRTYYLYKGQGRVVVANDSAYTANASVVEVQIDPTEVGYR